MKQKSKALLAASGLLVCSSHAKAEVLQLDFELTSEAKTPAETVVKVANTVYSALGDIAPGERTQSQNQLYDVLNYAISNIGSTDPVVLQNIVSIYNAISPKKASSNSVISRKNPAGASIQGIGKRLSFLRRQSTRVNFQPSYQRSKSKNNSQFPLGGGLLRNNATPSGGLLDQRLSGFITSNYISNKQSETLTESGFSGGTFQLLAGSDYRINNDLFAGAAISYLQGEMDIANNGGSLSNTATTLLAYASYNFLNNWHIDATVNSGKRQFDLKRKINFSTNTGATSVTAASSPDSDYSGLNVGIAYEFSVGNAHNISLSGNIDYSQTTIDKFTEENAGGYNLSVAEQSITSTSLNIGGQWRKAFSTKYGVVLPVASLVWTQILDDGNDVIKARFIADPTNSNLQYETQNDDLSYLSIIAGTSMVFPRGLSGYALVNSQQLTTDYQQTIFTLGLRQEF